MFLSGMLARGRKGVKLTPSPRALRLARWLPALFWMAGIAYLSHQSRPLGAASDEVGAAAAHLTLYAVLAFTLYWPLSVDSEAPAWLPAALAFALTVIFGFTDELHQALVPGRVASEADLALDATGAVIGVGAALIAARVVRFIRPAPSRSP